MLMRADALVQEVAGRGSADAAMRILERLLRDFPHSGAFRTWDGKERNPVGAHPAFTLVFRHPSVLRGLVARRDALALAEAYCRGLVDLEGDLFAALRLKWHLQGISLGLRERLTLLFHALRLPPAPRTVAPGGLGPPQFRHRHTRRSDRAAVSYHYDLSNRFYALFLDAGMVYSCGYFESPEDTLEQAQCNKLEHICRKLRLAPGERLLDIGCGWGGLVCWASRHHGVRAHGITLSARQLEYARARIAREGLDDRVTVELRDYRELDSDAVFDKVASVGMLEHVGLANLPQYHATVLRVLRPGGLFLNHGITHEEEGWRRNVDSDFINRYVFPDAELDTVSNIQHGMESAGFEIHDVEGLRPHYALTLRHWVRRLEQAHARAAEEVGEEAYRTWQLYMAACALEFEEGSAGIYQILAERRKGAARNVPLTRRDLYVRAGPPGP